MRERPILFSAPMVRAILAGAKTQTRRVVKPAEMQRADDIEPHESYPGEWTPWIDGERRSTIECPYGHPGDRLWVRETWSPDPVADGTWAYVAWAGCRDGQIAGVPDRFRHPRYCNYKADWLHGEIQWTPSIHMPRWASRITLEITGVRVQMLGDITEQDAIAEGAKPYRLPCHPQRESLRHVDGFRTLWESINGPGSWERNPWVWVIQFRRVTP